MLVTVNINQDCRPPGVLNVFFAGMAGQNTSALSRAGMPFYTTKDYGTGLGLAVCYSITARHCAAIKVETGPSGTSFYVSFNPEC
jgi:signal transduction histidine kinase